jgi:hypothetical protein
MSPPDAQDAPLIPSKKAPSFELLFRPSVDLISVVRGFVVDFYARVIDDPDTAHRLALVTHELLENAAKYSTNGEAALFVELDPHNDAVTVRTANRATASRIAVLVKTFAEITAARDAQALYLEAMRRSAEKVSGSGGLGLARIWAEGDMELRLVQDGDRVEIHARGSLRNGSPAPTPDAQ